MTYNIYKCIVCGKDCHSIGKHIAKHGLTPQEYYDKFLKTDNEGICPVCGAETKFKKITQGYAAYCCFEHFRISDLVKEHRKNTNLEKFGVENCFQSHECMQKSDETKLLKYGDAKFRNEAKIRETCLAKYGFENPAQSEMVKQKINDSMIKHFGCHNSQDPECRKRMRTRYTYENIKFDSSYEIAFYIWNKDHGINVERCYDSFEYEVNGKIHKYFPDFKINDSYYEIKGEHLITQDRQHLIDPHKHSITDETEAKMQCIRKNNIEIVDKDKIIFYIKYVKQKYGQNYIKQFKNKGTT